MIVRDDFVEVAVMADVPEASSHLVVVNDVRIALFNLNGEIYALEDRCTHDGGPLVEGEVVYGCEVECPRHGARFDIRTGAALCFPAFQATTTYDVTIDGDAILIESPV